MTHDCGHICCDERGDPHHDHFLAADACPACRVDESPQAVTYQEAILEGANPMEGFYE